ncbi:hypothetical protein [Burkholderia sp. LMU1-1-1.1]|uniref:hypothetical protein n=1 Tax=Burkholderia sp. LMU1-1-1.1 TaxID=3135266 RepID=UPI00343BA67E
MSKKKTTEQNLIDALDRLLIGESRLTDGRVTQKNIALEAGVSRATFNRYAKVVDEYRLARTRSNTDVPLLPFTIEDKNRELQEANIAMRKKLIAERVESQRNAAGARQEVLVLSLALKARDKTIDAKDREIAQLKRQLISAQQEKALHIQLVRDATP